MFHLDRIRPVGVYAMDRWATAAPRRVDVLLGACMLLRRVALEQVGLLDESYFMYSEDLDLAYRLNRGGWELFWVPGAEVVHFGGQSTRQIAREMFLRLYRSKILFFEKYYGKPAAAGYRSVLVLASTFRLALTPAAWILRPGGRGELREQIRGYSRLIRELVGG
jgi:GT2 family glycosyltransferase